VCALGPKVKQDGLSIGTRVLVRAALACGQCAQCRAGDDNLCYEGRVLGVHLPGGYAQYVAAPAWSLMPIPDALGFAEAAALPSAFVTAWHMCVALAAAKAGEWVLVPSASGGVGSA